MTIRSELLGRAGGFHRDFLARHGHTFRIVNAELLARHVGDIAFFQIDDPLRDLRKRGRVGCKKMVVLSDADKQGAARTRADHAPGLARADRRNRIGAVKFRDRLANRNEQVSVVIGMDEMRDDLGVGLRDEAITLLLQALPQGLEVLDDAVVDNGNLAAQRVCEIPVSPQMRVTPACAARSATRAVLTRRCRPPLMTASPLESYPRYSSLRMPSMRMGSTFSRATAPTMPHMISVLRREL